MKVNELRIGNWIKYEDKLVQVVQLSSLMLFCQRDENQFLVNCAPKVPFAKLINKLNGKDYWESNPLGYAYEFELVK